MTTSDELLLSIRSVVRSWMTAKIDTKDAGITLSALIANLDHLDDLCVNGELPSAWKVTK